MKKNILSIILFALITSYSFAQSKTDSVAVKAKDYPVNGVFESGYLIDAQTTVIPAVKTLEFGIQHKFGTMDNKMKDLYGLYGSANIRLALNYVPVKNLQIGAGITKRYMMTDVNLKYNILEQTRKNTMPVSLTFYGNIGIDGSDIGGLDTIQAGSYVGAIRPYAFGDRLSYFSELIVSRKFCKEFSLQAALSFTHYNAVKPEYDHDKLGVHVNGRIKVTPMGSIIFNYDMPLKISGISEHTEFVNPPKPSIAFGYEVSTGTHAFQMFIASTQSLLPQDNIMWNQNEINSSGLSFGFVITRLWGF